MKKSVARVEHIESLIFGVDFHIFCVVLKKSDDI